MASINYATREISCKIVYYGPGLSGKTTNLQIIHRKIPDKDKSEMVSLATETDRTLFFDFLPLDLGSIKGFSTKFQLYTVPGQVYYNATRKLVLRGVDGVVFVVDSQVDKLQENLESFANLQENLREYGHSIENIPLVLQYNKRDLPNVYPVQQLNALINKYNLPYYEAVAATGVGVFTTLKAIGKSVIDKFNAKYAGFQGSRRSGAPVAPPRPSAPAASGNPAAPAMPQRPAPGNPPAPGFGSSGFGAPGPQAPNPFAGTPPRPGAPQPFPGNFGAPPQAAPRPAPAAPAPGGFGSSAPAGANPFMSPPAGMPTSAGFPGSMPSAPKPATQAPGGFGAPPASPFGGPASNPGFGMGAPNPFSGNAPAAPQSGLGPKGEALGKPGFPGAPAGGPGGFPPFPGPKPAAPGGSGPQAPGGLPQSLGNPGFQPPPGIPVSPFVESFGQGRPNAAPPAGPASGGFGAPPGGGLGAPAGMNPFAAPPKPLQPMPAFGAPPAPAGSAPRGGNFASPFPGAGGQGPASGGPGPGFPPSGGFGGAMNPPGGGFGGGGFEGPGSSFAPPAQNPGAPTPFPNPDQAGPGPSRNSGGFGDASGIVTTFEDLQKDDSFKTKKLPHPNEKKKGFFDGLFRKDK